MIAATSFGFRARRRGLAIGQNRDFGRARGRPIRHQWSAFDFAPDAGAFERSLGGCEPRVRKLLFFTLKRGAAQADFSAQFSIFIGKNRGNLWLYLNQ